MPDVRMPNGTIIRNVPVGITQAQLLERVGASGLDTKQLLTPPSAGFTGAFSDAVQTLGLGDEAATYAANPTEETRKAFLKAARSKYRQVGFGEGENWEALKQLAGSSLGFLAAPVVAGVGASAATTPVGGLAAAAGTTYSQYTIQNLLRQAETQEQAVREKKAPEPLSVGRALAASAGQTALDAAAGPVFGKLAKAFPFMRPLLGRAGAKGAERAGAIIADAAEKGTIKFAKGVAKGVGEGIAFEVPQEVIQQGLERWQAGLSLSDSDALDEYKQAAIGAAVLGGGFGGIEGAVPSAAETTEEPAVEGTKLRAPEGFQPADVATRLRAPFGKEGVDYSTEQWLRAIERRVNNDLAFGTPEALQASEDYFQSVRDKIDSGLYPDTTAEPLLEALKQAKAIVSDYADKYVAPAEAEAQAVPEAAPVEAVPEAAPVEAVPEAAPVEAVPEAAPVEAVPEAAPVEPPVVPPSPPQAVASPASGLTTPEFEAASAVVRNFSDRFADAPKVTEYFKTATGIDELPEEFNLGRKFELYQTKKNAAQRVLERDFQKPILDEIKKGQVPLQDMALYLLARAAPDRNRIVAERNAQFPEGGSGLSTAEAADIMTDLAARGMTKKLEKIASMHDELVDHMLAERVSAGLLTEDEANAMRKAEPFYTPFKGFAADGDFLTSDEQEDAHSEERRAELMRKKRGLGMREFFKAEGRDSLPFHPLFNLFVDSEALTRRTAMNEVYRTFLKMTEANPEAMSDFITGIYTDKRPKLSRMPDPNDPSGRLVAVPMRKQAIQDRTRFHVVKDGGETKYIEFSNTEAGQAAQRLFSNMTPEEMSKTMRVITGINNALKGLLTYRNPLYLSVVAPLRDTLDAVATAMYHQNLKGSPAFKKNLAAKVAAYSAQPATWRTVTRFVMDRDPVPGREDLMASLEQMLVDGGSPMQVPFKTAQESATAAAKDLNRLRKLQEGNPLAIGAQSIATVGKFFDHWAEINDIVPRFATYRAAVEAGLSGPEAASLALDSSLNLTKRGEMSNLMDNIMPFFSASVEGSLKLARIAKNPRSLIKVVGGVIAIGILESLANATFGGDDDDDGVPDYLDVDRGKRMSRLNLQYGGGDADVSIPIGQMLGYFKYIGNKIADTWLGVTSGEAAGAAIASAGVDLGKGLLSLVSPARIQGGDIQSVLTAFIPLLGKPIVDLARNQNFFGTPIYHTQFEDSGPRSELGRAATADWWKGVARTLNSITGGSPATSGAVDFQPEVYQYLVETYLGGAARLFKQGYQFAQEPEVDKIPVIRGFTGDGFDYVPQNKFRKNTQIIEDVLSRGTKMTDEQLLREQERHPLALSPDVVDAYVDVKREIDGLYRERKQTLADLSDSAERRFVLDYYQGEMNKLWSAFNYFYEQRRREQQ